MHAGLCKLWNAPYMYNELHAQPAGQSMDHHFLTSYHHAIMSTVLAQFSHQGFLDGMEGIVKLVKASPYFQVCLFNVMVDPPATLQLLSESQQLCAQ